MSVIALLFVALLIVVPVLFFSRRRTTAPGGSPAEFLVYLILVVATLVATNAFSSLVEIVLSAGDVVVRGSDDLALSLATLLVAGVVAFLLWRRMETQTAEPERPARALYVSGVIGFCMAVVAASLVRLGTWIGGESRFSAVALADLVAFAATWWLHERIRRRSVPLDALRSIAGSLVGLTLTSFGLAGLLRRSLDAAFESGTPVAGSGVWGGLVLGLVLLVVGVPFHWWFWFRDVVRTPSVWREGFALVAAITGWFTAIPAVGALLYSLLIRAVGIGPGAGSGSPFPVEIALAVTGGVVYWHHRQVLGHTRTPSVRVLAYLFSTAAFATGAGSLVALLVSLILNLTGDSVVGSGQPTVLAALVALVVSGVVLWLYWLPAQRLAGEPSEDRATSRRLAIVALLTGSALAAVGGLIAVLYALLRLALGNETDVGDILTTSVPLTVVAGLLAWYFARIRPQRRDEAVVGVGHLKVSTVTVVAADPGPLREMVPNVRVQKRSDGNGVVDEEMARRVVEELAKVESAAALVVVDDGGFEVIPLA